MLNIDGIDALLWNWHPDWSRPVLERLEWSTDVLAIARGEEQRRSLRVGPRQYVEFSTMVSDAERRYMEAMVWDWGSKPWVVPLWFDGLELTSTLSSGATSIPLDPATRGFEDGGLVLLTNDDPRTFEVIEIDGLSTSIGLDVATTLTWPAGTRVYPARLAAIEAQTNLERFTGRDAFIRTQWRMLNPATWTAAATPTYRSTPVLEHRPNWIVDPAFGIDRKETIFDSGTGKVEVIDEAETALPLQRMRVTLTSRAQIDEWKQRLFALRGRQGAIWVPSWADDFQVVADIASAATTIDVRWCGYVDHLVGEPNRQDIRIELADGTVFYRRISAAAEISSTVERLTIDSALGEDVAAGNVAAVSFLAASRSESDSHEFAYFTGECADTTFAARGFRNGL